MSGPLCALWLVLTLGLANGLSLEGLAVGDGYEAFPGHKGSRYKLNTTYVEWTEASDSCLSDGALLIIINSETEAELVRELMPRFEGTAPGPTTTTYRPSSVEAWVGIKEYAANGNWITLQGTSVASSGYANWAPYEPHQSMNLDCGLVNKNAQYLARYCAYALPFICEKPRRI